MKALGWKNIFQVSMLITAFTLLVSCGGNEKEEAETTNETTETTKVSEKEAAPETEVTTSESADSVSNEAESSSEEVAEGTAKNAEETTTESTSSEKSTSTPSSTPNETVGEEVKEKVEEVVETVEAGPAKMEFEEKTFNFGEIMQGDVVEHSFTFKNVGGSPLVITNARGSCGCTVPEWPKGEIQPGDTEEIFVKFNSRGKRGAQTKSVTLTTNYGSEVIYVKGKVNVPEEN